MCSIKLILIDYNTVTFVERRERQSYWHTNTVNVQLMRRSRTLEKVLVLIWAKGPSAAFQSVLATSSTAYTCKWWVLLSPGISWPWFWYEYLPVALSCTPGHPLREVMDSGTSVSSSAAQHKYIQMHTTVIQTWSSPTQHKCIQTHTTGTHTWCSATQLKTQTYTDT